MIRKLPLLLLILLLVLCSCSKEYWARRHFDKAVKLDSTILQKVADSTTTAVKMDVQVPIHTEEKNYTDSAEVDTTEKLVIDQADLQVWATKLPTGKTKLRAKIPAKDTTLTVPIEKKVTVPNKLIIIKQPPKPEPLPWWRKAILFCIRHMTLKNAGILLLSAGFIKLVLLGIKKFIKPI